MLAQEYKRHAKLKNKPWLKQSFQTQSYIPSVLITVIKYNFSYSSANQLDKKQELVIDNICVLW